MNYLLAAITTKFSGSTVSSDVGGRIFLDEAPEGTEFPYIVFNEVTNIPEYPGYQTMDEYLFDFSIYSDSQSASQVTTVLADLRTLLDDCSLTITGSTLVYFIRGNLTTLIEEITTPTGTGSVKHYIQEYSLTTVK